MTDVERLSAGTFGAAHDLPIAADEELARDCRRSVLASAMLGLAMAVNRKGLVARAGRLGLRCEGGAFYSATAREVLRDHFNVRVGAYSYGECMQPGAWPGGVVVGRYVSVAKGVRVFLRNHPLDRLSLHPFFYNHRLGFVDRDTIDSTSLFVGHDAWLGEQAIITPGCSRIGVGAVVGAGAVVTKDVEDFAIVAGNPARVLRLRFDEGVRASILDSRWWERPIQEVGKMMDHMLAPLDGDVSEHPLLRRSRAGVGV